MITSIREATRSLWMWIVLGVLALGFGLSFGLPSDAISLGQDPLARIYGEPLRPIDYNYQYAAFQVSNHVKVPKGDKRMQELMGLKEEILEAVVERRVLARAAEEMGLVATREDAEDLTLEGQLIVLGDTINWLGGRKFNYDRMFKKGLLPNLQTNERDYLERQRQELLARSVRDLIASSVIVPESAVRAAYEQRANQVSLRYVRFTHAHFAELVDPAPAEVEAHVASHREELLAQFTSQGVRFTKLPKQVRLRLIKVQKPAAPAEDADEEATEKHAGALAAARAKIEAAHARLEGGEDFRKVARELSEDQDTSRGGGDYGWASLEGTGTGLEAIVDETAAALEPGAHSAVVASDEAFYVVKVDGVREGDVPEEDALRELAEEALKAEGGKTLARQAAEEALLKVREDKKTLAEIFTDTDALGADGGGIETLPIDGELSPGAGSGADSARPQVRETGLFARSAPIPGIGPHAELTQAAWEGDPADELIDRIFETDTDFLVAGVDRRETASDEGFAAAREEIYAELARTRSRRMISWFAKNRCLTGKAKGQIKPVEDKIRRLITYDTNLNVDEQGVTQMRPYQMCDRVGMRGGLFRIGGMANMLQASDAPY